MRYSSPSLRFRAMIAAAALAATFGPLSAHADSPPSPDAATAAAITTWRTAAVALVEPAFRDVVAASYADQTVTTDASWFGVAMVKRAAAEQAAWSTLDPAAVALIEVYFQQVQEANAPAPNDA